jgi:hypothetical protein
VLGIDVNYVLGLDLGQSRDPTALAVVRRLGAFGFEGTELYQVGHLERLPLGTSYAAIVAHVKWVLGQLPKGSELVIDFTGVGRPVYDMFVDIAGIDPIGVLITGGNTEGNDGRVYSVPCCRWRIVVRSQVRSWCNWAISLDCSSVRLTASARSVSKSAIVLAWLVMIASKSSRVRSPRACWFQSRV